jgi:hypothetical protein
MTRNSSFLLLLLATNIVSAEGLPRTLVDSFDGWTPSQDPACWSVEKGVVSLVNDPEKEGSTLWTDKEYGDFILEFEFKFGPGFVDSGVFIRQVRDQIQVGKSGSLKRDMTASPYIGGKGYPVEASGVAELLRQEDWNAMKIVVVGSRYDVWLNGRHVMNYESDTAAERGPIGLQIHPGREMRMEYRQVRLAELK